MTNRQQHNLAIPSKEIPFGKDATIQMYNAFCGKDGTIKMFCDHFCDRCRWKNQKTLMVFGDPR